MKNFNRLFTGLGLVAAIFLVLGLIGFAAGIFATGIGEVLDLVERLRS